MNYVKMTGAQFRDMMVAGAVLLEKNKQMVNALNVFPVPDGDTGTNMSMTMQSAVKEMRACPDNATLTEVADALSIGALKGARGNSGVILSQIFRGFSRALKGAAMLDGKLFSEALTMGAEDAYKAVMKPREGTILTVSRVIAEDVAVLADQGANVYRIFDEILRSGEIAVQNTPNLLPVLKEAGVVDSGGKGLLAIYRGCKLWLDGEEVEAYGELLMEETPQEAAPEGDQFSGEHIEYGYCTEFFIIHPPSVFTEEEVNNFRGHLERIGDSVVVAFEDDFVKVHVHSNAPGKVIQMALRLGEVNTIKIDNMREQNRQLLEERKRNEKEFGLVSVSAGEGIDELFRALSVDSIIPGGQTMNPSIETIAAAINKINARNVFVLPNNSNIILAAQEACHLTDKKVILLPTKTIPQGIAACMAYSPDEPQDYNEEAMRDAFTGVVSGAVTYAVRKSSFEGDAINKGDIIGLMDNHLAAVAPSIDEAAMKLLEKMVEKKGAADGSITIFYGEGIDEEKAGALAEAVQERYPDAEVIPMLGGQPLYYYYISVQ